MSSAGGKSRESEAGPVARAPKTYTVSAFWYWFGVISIAASALRGFMFLVNWAVATFAG